MAWETIVEASSVEELEYAIPTVSELPHGTEIIIRFDLPLWVPIGKLADLAGSEWWGQMLAGSGMKVTDVRGNWHWMEIHGIANAVHLAILIPLIITAVRWLGIAFLSWMSVKISANIITKPAEIVKEREAAKIEFIEKWAPIYGTETVKEWLEGIKSPPPAIKLPEGLGLGIGAGVIVLAALVALLIFRR